MGLFRFSKRYKKIKNYYLKFIIMKICICNWQKCQKNFSWYITKRLISDIEKFWLKNIDLEETSCMWKCSTWPNIKVDWIIYNNMNPAEAAKIMHFVYDWESINS